MTALRVIFMGTPELACASLLALFRSPGLEVAGVVTQPDRPKGRDLKLAAPPVKELAQQHGLTILQPEKARDEDFMNSLRVLKPDLVAVAAYGQILPKSILELPPFGCLNVHTSLLPRYRGAAPIQWALLNGDSETGVTIMKMDAGMDTGPILAQSRTPITSNDDAQTLHDRLAAIGADLLVQTIPRYISGEVQPQPQPHEGIVYASRIKKQDGKIDWSQPALNIWNKVRALVPWPVAFTSLPGTQQVLRIWRAEVVSAVGEPGTILQADKNGITVACGSGALKILELQREGGRRLPAPEFLAGKNLIPGSAFGS